MIRAMRKSFVLLFALAVSFNTFARESTLLDSGWEFCRGDADIPSQAISRADLVGTNWQDVSIPHCWGWEDLQQGKTNYYRGPGWYRRELDVTPQTGKRYYLRFEAASSVADVYLNGQLIGEHRGAFGAFCFEITTNLSASGTNFLQVRVDNSPQPDIAPLSGDFPVYGGIYRPVHLIETEANSFTVTDHASPGIAWLQTSVSQKQALLDVTTEIANGFKHPETLSVVASVFDAAGKCVATTNQSIFLTTNRTAEPCWLHVVVPKPHLWNGRADPYLYKAVVELRSTNNVPKVWDTVEQSIGLRFYRVDPDKGFFLNGKPYALHGVDKHQDRWDKGWAVSESDLDEDIALIKEIGATVIRCAHYQHSDYFYSLCDKAGILVWVEIPQVNEITASEQFENTSRNQLLDLIRQNINHPAIFVWSLFNEQRPTSPDPEREIRDMKIIANGEDPTRPTIAATFTDQLPQMNKIPDLLGWNKYPGWYGKPGDMTNFSALLDKMRYTSQHGGFCVSEYGAGANVFQHEQNPVQTATTNQWHPEEWQAIVHEQDWAILKSKPYIWATFVWNMFDFESPVRHEGGVFNRNDKGLVTADRKIKKDAFYFYKANWSDQPVLYLTDRRFTERTNTVTDVKIYSNARKVELLVNGVSLGKQSNATNCVFIWKNVPLKPGENQIAAKAKRDGKTLSDSCVWTLK
jgi:beta-galactosidase